MRDIDPRRTRTPTEIGRASLSWPFPPYTAPVARLVQPATFRFGQWSLPSPSGENRTDADDSCNKGGLCSVLNQLWWWRWGDRLGISLQNRWSDSASHRKFELSAKHIRNQRRGMLCYRRSCRAGRTSRRILVIDPVIPVHRATRRLHHLLGFRI